jgi:hypothetical protein
MYFKITHPFRQFFPCPFPGCDDKFDMADTIKKHIQRAHDRTPQLPAQQDRSDDDDPVPANEGASDEDSTDNEGPADEAGDLQAAGAAPLPQ